MKQENHLTQLYHCFVDTDKRYASCLLEGKPFKGMSVKEWLAEEARLKNDAAKFFLIKVYDNETGSVCVHPIDGAPYHLANVHFDDE